MVMRPTTLTITATGTSQAVPFDYYTYGMGVGVTVLSSAGTCIYTVQHTFNDPGAANLNSAGVGTWLNHDDTVLVAASANANSNYAFVPRAARVVVTGSAPSMTVTFVPLTGQ